MGVVACSSCWKAASELWVELLLRVEAVQNFTALPFEPTDIPDGVDFAGRTTGASAFWAQDAIALVCAPEGGTSKPVPAALGQVVKLGYHFDWSSARGELWIGDQSTATQQLFARPADTDIACAAQPFPPTGWLARGNIKPEPGAGTFTIDEIRIAASRDALTKGQAP